MSLPNPSKTSLQFDFSAFQHSEAWAALFGMFYMVFLDSTGEAWTPLENQSFKGDFAKGFTCVVCHAGCAFALAGAMDQHLPGFVKQPGFEFPRRMAAHQ